MYRVSLFKSALFLFGLVLNQAAWAKLFSNSYVSFELPPEWQCAQEGTEWVCVSKLAKEAKEAMIILTAKEVGPSDSLEAYLAYLKQPRVIPGKDSRPLQSRVLQVKQGMIANHPWVDAMHEGSEVPQYYTRYLATVKDKVAILVTFSAHVPSYTRYSNDFIRAINSLRVTATKDIVTARGSGAGMGGGKEILGSSIPGLMDPSQSLPYPKERSGLSGMNLNQVLGVALLVLGLLMLGGWFIWSRQGKKPSQKRSTRKR